MTFDRFYGIIKPHKASSFNTVKRAKITCLTIAILSIIFNIPHLFLYLDKGYDCIPYSINMDSVGKVYYGLSFIVNFSFPFFALLIMNSVIIHMIRTHKSLNVKVEKERQPKTSERQIFIILLLVTFSFLILTTPGYIFFLLNVLFDTTNSPQLKASFALYYSIGQKLWYTNNGINFFLYILSGTKFRNDFKNILQCQGRSKNQLSMMNYDSGNYTSGVTATKAISIVETDRFDEADLRQ